MADTQARSVPEISRAYARRAEKLGSIARRAGEQDSEDVMQDAFLQVVETSRREEVRKVDHLLARVARCVAIDRVRRRSSRPTIYAPEMAEAVEGGMDPERLLIGSQRLQRALSIIDKMPPRRREVFLLHRVEELTYAQIGRQVGISIKAVEKHIGLALKQLAADEL